MAGLKTKVTCPRCKESFNYEFVPGASLYSIRLGNYRYMKCSKCGKWGLFNITRNLPHEQKSLLGLSGLLFGSLLLVLSAIFLFRGIKLSDLTIEVAGGLIFLFSLFVMISGMSNLKQAYIEKFKSKQLNKLKN